MFVMSESSWKIFFNNTNASYYGDGVRYIKKCNSQFIKSTANEKD